MAGDRETGVMVMRMEEGLDTGPVCLAERVPIGADETAGDLRDRLAPLGADLMVRALAALERGALACAPQPETGVTYADEDRQGGDAHRLARGRPPKLHNQIRGLSPFPGAWCEVPRGGGRERVKMLRRAAAEGAGRAGHRPQPRSARRRLRRRRACGSTEVQRAGKKPAAAAEFLRGARLGAGADRSA